MIAAARGSVARACGLLVVGQRQHAQGEDLVDLGRVEHRAGALRRDRRVVVQDDRRGQHDVRGLPVRPPSPARTGQHRCWRQRPAASRASSGGSITETNRAPPAAISRCAPISDDRRAASLSAARGRGVARPPRRSRTDGRRRLVPRATIARSGHRRRTSRPAGRRLDVLAAVDPHGEVHAGRSVGEARTCPARARPRPPRPSVVQTAVAGAQLADRRRSRRAVGALGLPPLQLEEAQVHGHPCAVASSGAQQALDREVRASSPTRPRPPRAGRAHRTASAPGSWPRWTGRGRAGTPRRGRRRRRAGPGRGVMATAHRPSRAASSVVTTSSQLVRPRTCR